MADVSSNQLQEAIVLMKEILEQQKQLALERQQMLAQLAGNLPKSSREEYQANIARIEEKQKETEAHLKQEREVNKAYREQVLALLGQLVEATKK
jgi:hypothetical protein